MREQAPRPLLCEATLNQSEDRGKASACVQSPAWSLCEAHRRHSERYKAACVLSCGAPSWGRAGQYWSCWEGARLQLTSGWGLGGSQNVFTYRDPPDQMEEKSTKRSLLGRVQRKEAGSHASGHCGVRGLESCR